MVCHVKSAERLLSGIYHLHIYHLQISLTNCCNCLSCSWKERALFNLIMGGTVPCHIHSVPCLPCSPRMSELSQPLPHCCGKCNADLAFVSLTGQICGH